MKSRFDKSIEYIRTRDRAESQCEMKDGKSFRCEVLNWHTPTTIYVRGLSTTFESTCKRCGRLIMQDSQGNWFAYSKKGGAE